MVLICQAINNTKMDLTTNSLLCPKWSMDKRVNSLVLLRKAAGLTQEELADILGTSQTQIMRLEGGKRQFTPKWAERISRALNDHYGYEAVKTWHFFVDPEELEGLVASEEEKALLRRRRALQEAEQKAFDQMTKTFADTLNKVRRTQD